MLSVSTTVPAAMARTGVPTAAPIPMPFHRVVVLSAGPASRPIGEFTVDLPRPRDVAEVRHTAPFMALHEAIWGVLREEVLKGYAQQWGAQGPAS